MKKIIGAIIVLLVVINFIATWMLGRQLPERLQVLNQDGIQAKIVSDGFFKKEVQLTTKTGVSMNVDVYPGLLTHFISTGFQPVLYYYELPHLNEDLSSVKDQLKADVKDAYAYTSIFNNTTMHVNIAGLQLIDHGSKNSLLYELSHALKADIMADKVDLSMVLGPDLSVLAMQGSLTKWTVISKDPASSNLTFASDDLNIHFDGQQIQIDAKNYTVTNNSIKGDIGDLSLVLKGDMKLNAPQGALSLSQIDTTMTIKQVTMTPTEPTSLLSTLQFKHLTIGSQNMHFVINVPENNKSFSLSKGLLEINTNDMKVDDQLLWNSNINVTFDQLPIFDRLGANKIDNIFNHLGDYGTTLTAKLHFDNQGGAIDSNAQINFAKDGYVALGHLKTFHFDGQLNTGFVASLVDTLKSSLPAKTDGAQAVNLLDMAAFPYVTAGLLDKSGSQYSLQVDFQPQDGMWKINKLKPQTTQQLMQMLR